MTQGAAIIGMGVTGKGATDSELLFNTDGNGTCSLGSPSGNIKIKSGNAIATIRGMTLRSNNSSASCMINASTDSSHQVGNFTLERVNLYPKSGSTVTNGLFLGNIVRARILNNYFAPGFSHDVVDTGSFFIASQFQKNTFDGPLVSSNTEFAVILASGVSAVDFSDNIFEPHPNGIKVLDGYGVTIKGNWFGDIRSNQGGTLIDYAGSGGMITGNSINANDHDAGQINAIRLSGRGGNTVSGNWIDASKTAVTLEGPGNTVVGNEIFTPSWIGVYIGSYTSNNVGPNNMRIGAGGGRMPFYCVALASGNYITSETGSQNGARASCSQSNVVSNVVDKSLYGYSYININSTSSVPGQALILDTDGVGSTYGSNMLSIINGPGGNVDYNRSDLERNSVNNGPFRYSSSYGDLNLINNTPFTYGSGSFGRINFIVNGDRMLQIGGGNDRGYVFIGSGSHKTSFNQDGGLYVYSGSSITLSDSGGYITSQSSGNFSGLFSNTAAISSITASLVSASSVNSAGLTVNTSDLVNDPVNHRIGIKTSSPLSILDVKTASNHHAIVNEGALGPQLAGVDDSGASYTTLHLDGNPLVLNRHSAASVGIGTTAPQGLLHLSSNGGATQVWTRLGGGTDAKNWDVGVNNANVMRWRVLSDDFNTASTWMDITRSGTNVSSVYFPNGNIGMGVSPSGKLHIKDTASNTWFYIDSIAGSSAYQGFSQAGVLKVAVWKNDAENKLNIGDGSLVKTAVFDVANQRLGLGGNASPISALDVTGTITQSVVKSCGGGLTTDANGSITGCNSSAGVGDAILAANQRFSGMNVFASTTTIGYATSTLINTPYTASTLMGGESLVAITSVTASATPSFSGLSSSQTWRVEYCFVKNSAGNFAIQFNGDTSAVYQSAMMCQNTGASNSSGFSNNALGYIHEASNGLTAGGKVCGSLKISTLYGSPNSIYAESELTSNTQNVTRCSGSVGYYQSAPLTSVNFATNTGTFTGWMKLYLSAVSQSLN
jgi:hypothetical protein